MNVKFTLLFLIGSIGMTFHVPLISQESEPATQISFKKNKFQDNCFAQLGFGGQFLIAEEFEHLPFSKDRITFAPIIGLGKWIKPYLGVRMKVEGGVLHSFYSEDQMFMQKDSYVDGQLNLLWNLTNSFGTHNSNRKFNLSPYVGAGCYHRNKSEQEIPVSGYKKNDSRWNYSLHAGFLFEYRLHNRTGVYAEIAGMMTEDYFNRIKIDDHLEGILSFTIGFICHFGKTGFVPEKPSNQVFIKKYK